MTKHRIVPLLTVGALALTVGCSSTVVREPSAHTAGAVRVSTPKPGATTVVQRGDTLYSIATRNGISVLDLASWNALPPPYTIYPGQRLRLYPGAARVTSVPTAPPRNGTTSTPRPSTGTTTSPTVPRPAPPPVVIAPPASGFAWRWPAEGGLVSRYVPGEPTKQGIDIGGTEGTPVRAAADGTVVYSGAGLVGYGELVIIKHNDQWLTAYGHNRKRLVNEGQIVKSGEAIAEMGHSGAPRDMLHFEIRYAGKPVDPLLYLPAR
ncbi:LysM peptidoglycan-binding domain-containing protein [Lysobacter sp. TY2-98]|uniref:peptidoglycan DD-metalloendopeptidase family protein n=1 Tax=Lysobacter sp. TY2-98 TaxID=2290922 RepID=UPI000E2060CF|nr:peptidoglycan DD-metalloendopeptidase family protein [Lysobacter sp. TY2-98]AXK72416.1 LysM peptidoglycan-binding domain-containing protein [Lysobacter sp. TY2-98]